MKKAKQADLKPLLEVLQGLNADGKTKGAAFNFLKMDLTQLGTDADFRRAFSGLLCAQQLLGPIHSSYLKTLDSMAKALKAYQKAHYSMTPAQWRIEIETLWKECCGIFKRFCPPEEWAKINQWTENLWRDVLK